MIHRNHFTKDELKAFEHLCKVFKYSKRKLFQAPYDSDIIKIHIYLEKMDENVLLNLETIKRVIGATSMTATPNITNILVEFTRW